MAYGACSEPTAAFAARITYVIGPDGKILQAHSKVTPKTHPEETLRSL